LLRIPGGFPGIFSFFGRSPHGEEKVFFIIMEPVSRIVCVWCYADRGEEFVIMVWRVGLFMAPLLFSLVLAWLFFQGDSGRNRGERGE
jgi:hypothetical protein